MTNHSRHGGVVVQGLRRAHRGILAGAVVGDAELEPAAAHAAAGVDLIDGELGGAPHRGPAGLGERPRETDLDRRAGPGARRERQRGAEGGDRRFRTHSRGIT